MQRLFSAVALLIVIGYGACAPNSRSGEPNRRPDLISAEEVTALGSASTALDLVQTLRPNWLRTRGTVSFNQLSPIVVYVDRMRLGGPRLLSQVPATTVESISFLDAMAATRQFGTDHANGAILVATRR